MSESDMVMLALSNLNQWALASLVSFGIPILLFISYIGSLGIPFPNTLVIIAAGAFAREGMFDWRLALLACLAGASLADHSEYLIGRFARSWIEKRFAQKAAWQQAESTIQKQGGWAIFLTRFWLMPLAPAVNLIAGNRYPYWRFLLYDLSGQFLWVLIYGGLGYLFVDQWQKVNQAVSGFSIASMALAVLVWGILLFVKKRRKKAKVS